MNAKCPLCGEDTAALNFIAEQFVLAEIAHDHPEWSTDDGACPKCIAYYRSLTDAVKVIDAAPEDLD